MNYAFEKLRNALLGLLVKMQEHDFPLPEKEIFYLVGGTNDFDRRRQRVGLPNNWSCYFRKGESLILLSGGNILVSWRAA